MFSEELKTLVARLRLALKDVSFGTYQQDEGFNLIARQLRAAVAAAYGFDQNGIRAAVEARAVEIAGVLAPYFRNPAELKSAAAHVAAMSHPFNLFKDLPPEWKLRDSVECGRLLRCLEKAFKDDEQ